VTTISAATFSPALSSDGRLITYVSDGGRDGETPQVWLQQIGGAALRLTSNQRECADPAFSSDDTRVIFTASQGGTQDLYEVPALGGQSRLLKNAAKAARFSSDSRWFAYISLDAPGSLRIAAADGKDDRPLAQGLFDVSCLAWSPDNRNLLILAHAHRSLEPDYWIVPIDGSPIDTTVLERLRPQGFKPLDCPPVWVGHHIIFSASTREGVNLWKQQLTPETFQPIGNPECLTPGTELAWFPAAAAGRLVFVATHPDMNLWSVAIDTATGMPYGPLRRLTRGPGILGHFSLTRDGRTLAYFTGGRGKGDLYLRDLDSGSDIAAPGGPEHGGRGFPAISPGGGKLAYGSLVPGPPVRRPVFVVDLLNGITQQVRDDCGGRPRQWLDERYLLTETFGSRLNRLAIVDTTTASQADILASSKRSLTNPRVSPNGAWIAFDAASPGGSPIVYVARASRGDLIQESEWIAIDEAASHPFWSRDGQILYYLALLPNSDIRGVVRAKHMSADSGLPQGEPLQVLTLNEMVVPTTLAGTTPIVAPDQIIFSLGDFRGDIWMMTF
jgi:Tol biopolymer transport system component